jgi:GT2 family glycosyltransferase
LTVVLQSLHFPDDPSLLPLYVRPGGDGVAAAGGLRLPPRGKAYLDSFRNACVVGRNGWPVAAGDIRCELDVRGDATVRLLARDGRGRERVLADGRTSAGATVSRVSLTVAAEDAADGRLFPTVEAGAAGATLLAGRYLCRAAPAPVRLAVVVCTFRREKKLLENLEALAQARDLQEAGAIVIVADNGGTLRPDALPPGCLLVPGPNLGGAGGFSRGMAAAMERGATHMVLLDDDVDLDPESISRCLALFRIAPDGAAVAGVLLDPQRPGRALEAGGWLAGTASPLVVRIGGAGLALDAPEGLDGLWGLPEPAYGGFWLFAFPARAAWETGLLLPFFFKADDVEFGLRLGRCGIALSLLSGVGVSHPPFDAAFNLSKRAHWVRNMLAVEALHGTRTAGGVARALWREAVAELRRLRYPHLAALVVGAEGFLRGPRACADGVDAAFARALARLGARLDPPPGLRVPVLAPPDAARSPWPTLFGHLLPDACLPRAARPESLDRPDAAWQAARYAAVDNGHGVIVYPLRRLTGLWLCLRAAWAMLRLAVRFRGLRRAWAAAAAALASPSAWRRRMSRQAPPR